MTNETALILLLSSDMGGSANSPLSISLIFKCRLYNKINGSIVMILGPTAIGQELGRILQVLNVHKIGINSTGKMANYMNITYLIAQLINYLT